MDNSPRLPIIALIVAALSAGAAAVSAATGAPEHPVFALSALEIGLVAAALALGIFGLQGLISVLLEGRRLEPGIVPPRLTDPLSVAIVVLSLALVAVGLWLANGIVSQLPPVAIGLAAGIGCLVLAVLLVFYKEGFVGDEACFDDREDGVPW